VSDTTERLETMIELVKPYGIKEVIRTGTIAIQKGKDALR
jgi:acetolactate synthase I/III small subunit